MSSLSAKRIAAGSMYQSHRGWTKADTARFGMKPALTKGQLRAARKQGRVITDYILIEGKPTRADAAKARLGRRGIPIRKHPTRQTPRWRWVKQKRPYFRPLKPGHPRSYKRNKPTPVADLNMLMFGRANQKTNRKRMRILKP